MKSHAVAEASSHYQLADAVKKVPDGYKQTEVGVIPEDWECRNLGELCSLKSGLGITSRSVDDSSDYRCYGGNGLRGYTKQFTHEGEYALIGRQGALCGNIQHVTGKFFASEHALVATPSRGVNAKWLAIYLERMNLNQYSESSAQPGLSAEKLRVLNLMAPTSYEQTAIANALSDVDALILEQEKLIAKKQAIKTATMQQLLTGRTRLPQFALRDDGSPKGIKPSELGEIPEDWNVITLGSVSSFINGRAYALHEWENSGTPVIRLQNLTGRGDEYYYSNLQLPEKQYCKYGDLLFMWSATFGPMIWRGSRAIYHYHIWKIACNSGYNQSYLFYLLDDMTEKLKHSSSSGGTMLHVTKEKMESTKAVFPTEKEQTAIATILSDMDEEIQALEQRLNKTRQIKQGMMQQLLTGKTRLVKGASND